MKYLYGEYDGEEFPTQDKLFGFDQLTDFLLQYGDKALKAMQQAMKDPNSPTGDLLEQLIKEGLLDKDGKGKLNLTPKAVTRMQMKALNEIFANLRTGQREGHEKITAGASGERLDGTKPYQFGDPISDLDVNATLRNAMQRSARSPSKPTAVRSDRSDGSDGRASIPFRIQERDFEVYPREGTTSVSTVVLIDLSGSMSRYQRYLSSKKVALGLLALIRQRFPMDTIDFVGFYSGASKIPEIALPLVMPKPVTIYDYEVRMKCKVDQIDDAPQHFTNLHMGLQMARRLLRKRPGDNKQVFVITDGQPTAHVEGDFVYLLYPPDERSTVATLKEGVLLAREGVRISTFALIEDYYGMDWVGFVDQLTKLTKGVAFYTSSGELANCVMESYLTGRKKKAYVG
jgi:Ca-activated chloride channel family protein